MTDLNQPLPLPTPLLELQRRLATRRSAPAQSLVGPAPDAAQMQTLLTLALRTPDHGKLFPWRLVVLSAAARRRIATELETLSTAQPDPAKARAVLAKLTAPPTTVLVISAPINDHKVPVWEQQLSAGAVCMNLEHAANALGFSASWITDWYAYDAQARPLFGLADGESIAGFIHIGHLTEPPLERPRPTLADKVSWID